MEINNRPKLLYPSMVIAAIAVTVFSLLGIATLTGALPFAHSETKDAAIAAYEAGNGPYTSSSYTSSSHVRDSRHNSDHLALACTNCGVVESVRAVQVNGQGTGVGVVAGGITGALVGNGIGNGNGRTAATVLGAAGGAYAGNEIEKNTRKHTSYRIRVRMSNDSLRTLYQRNVPGVEAGDRVKIVDGAVVQQS